MGEVRNLCMVLREALIRRLRHININHEEIGSGSVGWIH
jgi:hypothetical protein